eukprot:11459224-Prorocentrum_lima.AAC.1
MNGSGGELVASPSSATKAKQHSNQSGCLQNYPSLKWSHTAPCSTRKPRWNSQREGGPQGKLRS